ncbi:hypothetical protein [Mesorhizobium intechi]|uniref:hypothetical protein n=1 Tax=Mesorhizobium intechi TaxID=537601 RepID=UPI00142E9C35|nr:hypothetical protein [Mesorhizobium intechi]
MAIIVLDVSRPAAVAAAQARRDQKIAKRKTQKAAPVRPGRLLVYDEFGCGDRI